MNRIIALVTALFLACLMAGCSASIEPVKSPMDTDARITALTAQVTALTQLVAAQQGNAGSPQGNPAAQMMPPPAHPAVMGMPQNFMWSDQRPDNCPKSLALEVINSNEDKYLELMIDGIGVVVRGAIGLLDYIPFKSTGWICLDRPGTHVISGRTIVNRMGTPVAITTFHFKVGYDGNSPKNVLEMDTFYSSLNTP